MASAAIHDSSQLFGLSSTRETLLNDEQRVERLNCNLEHRGRRLADCAIASSPPQ
jgi:hypothetical protein